MGPLSIALVVITLVAVMVSLSSAQPQQQRVVKIGVMFQSNGSVTYISETVVIATRMWQKYINDTGTGMGGTYIQPQLIYIDSGTTTASAVAATKKLIAQNVTAIIAPSGNQTPNVALAAAKSNVIVFSGEAASSDITTCQNPLQPPCTSANGQRRFKNLFSPFTPNSQLPANILSIFKLQGFKTLAIISLGGAAHEDVCITGGLQFAAENGFTVTYQVIIPYNGQTENVTLSDEYIEAAIANFTVTKPDVLFFCNRFACGRIFTMLQAANYLPSQIYTFQCVDTLASTIASVGDITRYVTGTSQWDYRMQGLGYDEPVRGPFGRQCATMYPRPNYLSPPSPMQFYTDYNRQPGASKWPMNSLTPFGIGSLYMLECAVMECNSIDFNCLLSAVQGTNMASFMGYLTSDSKGNNAFKTAPDIQVDQNSKSQIVTPAACATMSLSIAPKYLISPIPPWFDRIYNHQMFALPEEKFVIALVAVCCAIGSVTIFILVWQRYDYHIKPSSYQLCILITVGYMVGCCAVLTWPVENDPMTCRARLLTFALGFCLFFATLIVKVYRVAEIHNQQRMHVVIIPNYRLLIYIVLLSCALLLPVALWMGWDPLIVVVVVVDPLRPALNFATCSSASYDFAYWTLAIVASMLGYGIYLAWRLRVISEDRFKDSKSVFTCIFLFTFLLTIAVCLQPTLAPGLSSLNQRIALFMFQSVVYLAAYNVALVALLFERFWKMRSPSCAAACPCGEELSILRQQQQPQQTLDPPPPSPEQHTRQDSESVGSSSSASREYETSWFKMRQLRLHQHKTSDAVTAAGTLNPSPTPRHGSSSPAPNSERLVLEKIPNKPNLTDIGLVVSPTTIPTPTDITTTEPVTEPVTLTDVSFPLEHAISIVADTIVLVPVCNEPTPDVALPATAAAVITMADPPIGDAFNSGDTGLSITV